MTSAATPLTVADESTPLLPLEKEDSTATTITDNRRRPLFGRELSRTGTHPTYPLLIPSLWQRPTRPHDDIGVLEPLWNVFVDDIRHIYGRTLGGWCLVCGLLVALFLVVLLHPSVQCQVWLLVLLFPLILLVLVLGARLRTFTRIHYWGSDNSRTNDFADVFRLVCARYTDQFTSHGLRGSVVVDDQHRAIWVVESLAEAQGNETALYFV